MTSNKILEPYVVYQSAKIIYNFNEISMKDLFYKFKMTDKAYSSFNLQYFKSLIKDNFYINYNNDLISLSEEQSEVISFLSNVEINTENLEIIDILLELEDLNNLGFTKFSKILLYKYISFHFQKYNVDKESLDSYFFLTYNLTNDYVDILDNVINSIPDSLNNEFLNKYLLQRDIIDILFLLGIEKIIDLKNTSPYLLIILYNHKTKDLYYLLNSLKTNFKAQLLELLTNIELNINTNDYIIMSGRNGWYGKKETLEEVGKKLSVTRERVRQKEAKLDIFLYIEANKNKLLLNSFSYQLFTKYNTKILDINILDRELMNKSRLYITLIEKLENNSVNYSYEYSVIYIGEKKDLDVVVEKNLKKIPLVFSENKIGKILKNFSSELKAFAEQIIIRNYKINENIYIRKGFRISDLVLLTIDRLFPTGYRISSDLDFNILKNYIIDNYGDVGLTMNKRQVTTALNNHNYSLVDSGTYLNPIYLPKLNDNLVKEIIGFINNEGGYVYYDMIMHDFCEELNQLGVTNKYMLKGILDPELNNLFYTKRDYISKHKGVSSSTAINEYIDSKDNEFGFEDLVNRFGGVKDYTFYNVLYNRDDIIWLSNKRYIHKNNLHISDDVISKIYEECEKLFQQLKSDQISSKKIYAKLSFTNSELLKQMHVVKSHFDLFSVLQAIFKDKFYFNRPIISKTQDKTNFYDMLKNYLSSKIEFNKEIVDGYSEKMNIRYLYSYLDFLEDMSEEYVQINIDTMIRKDAFEISEEELKEIDESLKLIFTRMKLIDTKTFKGYYIFPQINRRWNKYLLIGVLRTYFSDKYDIENTINTYDTTEFLIRRRIDEK